MPTRRAFLDSGASPTALPLDAVDAAPKRGTVGGQENPFAQMWRSKFHEAERCLSPSGHVCTAACPDIGRDVIGRDVIGRDLWRRPPRGLQTPR
jgi:hypothetical protein